MQGIQVFRMVLIEQGSGQLVSSIKVASPIRRAYGLVAAILMRVDGVGAMLPAGMFNAVFVIEACFSADKASSR